jgi:hypothetical protein
MYLSSEHADLQFKLSKADARLVRAVFECNSFQQVEANDWNVMWSSRGTDVHLFDDLHEF